ncbi:hypothetical protein O0L34_g10991 [Tuta absoluta]|nr:hypothetical protein O0L34_g10991 [Tuta absoluta]
MSAKNCPCEPCRTINLARTRERKPDMQLYDKCKMRQPCIPIAELPVNPVCIKVCDREEYIRCTCPKPTVKTYPHIGHGKLMYVVKAGLLAGAVYFTYAQGIWGDQRDVDECMRRWQEYMRSLSTRRPPTFDKCGKVVAKETSDTILGPLYNMYKAAVTTVFAGVVKFPSIIKCMYLDYQKTMMQKEIEEAKERKIRRKSSGY